MSDDADDKLQTQHILITDVSQRNDDSLICWYRSKEVSVLQEKSFSWYHRFIKHLPSDGRTQITRAPQYYFGWSSKREISLPYQKLKLFRQPDSVGIEGVFTCDTGVGSKSVGIHYPSKLIVSK